MQFDSASPHASKSRGSELTIWIVSEGSPGHVSQSQGLAAALGTLTKVRVEQLECRARLNGVARSVVRTWVGTGGRPLPEWFSRRWAGLGKVPTGRPDMILSSGGKSVFAARTLAARYDAPYVFIGERKPYPSEWFHTVLTPSARETGPNDVCIDLIPTQVTRASVERAAAKWTERPSGRLWALVVGGASVSHRYVDSDWDALAAGLNTLGRAHGVRWLVTTSRRTGAPAEARLKTGVDPAVIASAVWWAEKPERKMQAFLGAAEAVLVTQDSVTMVTEAVSSGRPVIVVRPERVEIPPGGFMTDYFGRLEQRGWIRRSGIGELVAQPVEAARRLAETRPITSDLVDGLAAVVKERLKL
jgi:mitochondrial fission protein ELM1